MKESKLTKYTLVAMALLLIAYFSTDARAGDGTDVAELSAICAAANGVAGELTEQENLAAIFVSEGQWWYDFLEEWGGSTDIAKAKTTLALRNIQLAYNTGDLSWDDIMEIGSTCLDLKNQMLEEVES